jgi:tellurite resistance protein
MLRAMPITPGDDEDAYFKAIEIEQRKALRDKLAKQAKDLADARNTAAGANTDNLELAAKIRSLGFGGDAARVFDLLPLVHVAWADGKIQKGERGAILRILERRGIQPGTDAFRTMESLLEERPSDDYMNESLRVLRELTGGASHRADAIVDLCVKVASSSGGFLGIGGKIGDEERALIMEITDTLGSDAAAQFKDGLSPPLSE